MAKFGLVGGVIEDNWDTEMKIQKQNQRKYLATYLTQRYLLYHADMDTLLRLQVCNLFLFVSLFVCFCVLFAFLVVLCLLALFAFLLALLFCCSSLPFFKPYLLLSLQISARYIVYVGMGQIRSIRDNQESIKRAISCIYSNSCGCVF